jgi:isopentenyl-diphosphate delta-isomerase
MEEMILVDESDQPIGFEEKIAAHRNGGKLHRAFSIFIFNARGEMLLQRRSLKKYHFGGAWTNACCGHPKRGERLEAAAHRRLQEELGFDTDLKKVFSFTYTALDPKSGLTEREFDHVFVGEFHGVPHAHPDEIDELKWISPAALAHDPAVSAEKCTPWFAEAVSRLAQLESPLAGPGRVSLK